jgi:hypothetical protein
MTAYVEQELKLSFNEKTQIFPISQGDGLSGIQVLLNRYRGKVIRRLRTSNKKRWKRRLKLYQKQYRQGTKNFEEITRSMKSYQGHLKYGNTYRLRAKVYQSFVLTKHSES